MPAADLYPLGDRFQLALDLLRAHNCFETVECLPPDQVSIGLEKLFCVCCFLGLLSLQFFWSGRLDVDV